jgi:hypothetical protein
MVDSEFKVTIAARAYTPECKEGTAEELLIWLQSVGLIKVENLEKPGEEIF